MTVKELISELNKYDKEKVVTIYDGYGWSNIDKLDENLSTIRIVVEKSPLFSDN